HHARADHAGPQEARRPGEPRGRHRRQVRGAHGRGAGMSWLNAGFSLFGEHILWTDLIGNVLPLAVVWLAMRKTLWPWPVQIAGAALLLAASLHAHAPGNALKQVLF